MNDTPKFKKFKPDLHGFNYYYEGTVEGGDTVILEIPAVTANKRSVNDIGWMYWCENDTDADKIVVSGTLSERPDTTDMWQKLVAGEDANKTMSGIKIENNSANPCKVCVRVILC